MRGRDQRKLLEILRVIAESKRPVGARTISDVLSSRGYSLGERAIRYNLRILDELGFTRRHGYSGRIATPLGLKELRDALIHERIGFVNTLIEEYMLRTTFDFSRGDLVANISIVEPEDVERALEVMEMVAESGYSGDLVRVNRRDECAEIGTVCSITVDGLLLKAGVPVNTTFAGVLEIRSGEPCRFSDLIAYAGTSIDPMRAFMARRIARVMDAVRTGSGKVLANVREVPVSALEDAARILERARSIVGRIVVGDPGDDVLGCPVAPGRIGIAICAGVNAPVAVSECGVRIRTSPISALIPCEEMSRIRFYKG
ncbi:MAG: NrpR regulatory domain-containing protein [Methanothrix sp.]